jgi:hypothetical protein
MSGKKVVKLRFELLDLIWNNLDYGDKLKNITTHPHSPFFPGAGRSETYFYFRNKYFIAYLRCVINRLLDSKKQDHVLDVLIGRNLYNRRCDNAFEAMNESGIVKNDEQSKKEWNVEYHKLFNDLCVPYLEKNYNIRSNVFKRG